MICYSSGDFTLLNYVQGASSFKTLFRINSIKVEEVATPTLSSNYSRVNADGTQLSGGTPYGGGTIYLQASYCAINYEAGKGGFDIIKSANFLPSDLWARILPHRYYSTPVARMMGQAPKYMLLLDDGNITVMDDANFFGTEADYIGVNNGVMVGAFGVKARTFYGLPLPYTDDPNHWKAIARYLFYQGERGVYTQAPAVPGLVMTKDVKTEALRCRDLMRKYEKFDVDYEKATAFAAPLSLSLSKAAVVNSGLSRPNAVMYLSQKEQLGEDISNSVVGVVLDTFLLQDCLTKDGISNSLIEWIRFNLAPNDMVVLIDGDFQQILNTYNLEYWKKKGEASYAALHANNGYMKTAIDKINSQLNSHTCEAVKQILRQKGEDLALMADVFSSEITLQAVYNDDYVKTCPQPSTDPAQVSKIVANLGNFVYQYGDDSSLPDGDFDPETAQAVNNLKNLDLKQSHMFSRYLLSAVTKVAAKVVEMSPDTLERTHEAKYINKDRAGEIEGLAWMFSQHKRGDCDKYSTHAAIGQGQLLKEYRSVVLKQSSLQVNIRLKTTAKYDQTCHGPHMTAFKDTVIKPAMDDFVNAIMPGATWAVIGEFAGKKRFPKLCWFYDHDVWSDNQDFYVDVMITIPISPLVEITMVKRDFSDYNGNASVILSTGYQFLLNNGYHVDCAAAEQRASNAQQRLARCIDKVAAKAAYETCAYLFESLKDAYQYKPVAMLGTDFSGVPVFLEDVGRIASIDENYVATMTSLIQGIQDEATRDALAPFVSELKNAATAWKTQGKIYYIDYDTLMNAERVVDKFAIRHYVLGAFEL